MGSPALLLPETMLPSTLKRSQLFKQNCYFLWMSFRRGPTHVQFHHVDGRRPRPLHCPLRRRASPPSHGELLPIAALPVVLEPLIPNARSASPSDHAAVVDLCVLRNVRPRAPDGLADLSPRHAGLGAAVPHVGGPSPRLRRSTTQERGLGRKESCIFTFTISPYVLGAFGAKHGSRRGVSPTISWPRARRAPLATSPTNLR